MFDEMQLNDLSETIRRETDDHLRRLDWGTLVGEELITGGLLVIMERAIQGVELRLAPRLSLGGGGSHRSAALSAKSYHTDLSAESYHPKLEARGTSKVTEEPDSGADIVMVFDSDCPDMEVRKGLLVQAKIRGVDHRFVETGEKKLVQQCRNMLNITGQSYVFVYTPEGIFCFRASDVKGNEWSSFRRKDGMTIDEFFMQFFRCEIGDRTLQDINQESFKKYVENALFIEASDSGC
jgi:hypothetical protein